VDVAFFQINVELVARTVQLSNLTCYNVSVCTASVIVTVRLTEGAALAD